MPITVANTIALLRQAVNSARSAGRRIGLVPTMGALHAGHTSLIRACRKEAELVVVSIFVNPMQFGPQEDYGRYPRPLEQDLALAAAEGADLIFAPAAEDVYPPGFRTQVQVTGLQDGLCGRSRPGHFAGVCTVVLKLFNMVQPDLAFFGQKDAQQARIIQRMVRDLDLTLELRICPTVREPDGLALSSRNAYLTPDERRRAPVLYQALSEAARRVEAGERDAHRLRQGIVDRIAQTPGAALDYAELVDDETLEPIERLDRPTLAAVAVRFGGTRLIDNMVLGP